MFQNLYTENIIFYIKKKEKKENNNKNIDKII